MSPGKPAWEVLELDPEMLGRQSRFHLQYAEAADRFREVDPDAYEGSDGSEVGLAPFTDGPGDTPAPGDGDVPTEPDWAEREEWIGQAERGDALRQAAIATLVFDVEKGRKLLGQAANGYDEGSPVYAMFLEAVARPDSVRENRLRIGRELSDALSPGPTGRSMPTADGSAARALHAMFLVGATAEMATELRDPIERAAASPALRSPVPFGTAGSPLADWWRLAVAMCAPQHQVDRQELVDALKRLARPHGEQLRIARMDGFHWQSGLSRVDLVDLDLACATTLVNRRLGEEEEMPISSTDFADRISDLAQVSLVVGIDLADEEVDPPPQLAGVP